MTLPHLLRLMLCCGIALLGVVWGFSGDRSRAVAQSSPIEEAAAAVVRIVPQTCGLASCQNAGVGSGTVIHPNGVILTAWHVAVVELSRDPAQPHLYATQFIIEFIEDLQSVAVPRYRARLLAVDERLDLALLQIDATESGALITAPLNLPTLPIIEGEAPRVGPLRLMGYPPAGGRSISYPEEEQSGFDEGGALLKVQSRLSEGYSGGPALVERNGRLEIAGVVIRARGVDLEVGLIRNILYLRHLQWLVGTRRVWGENAHVSLVEQGGGSAVQFTLDIHALDFTGTPGKLLAYVFDAQSRQPWPSPNAHLSRTANGQLAFQGNFASRRFVDLQQGAAMRIPVDDLGASVEQLRFRLLLWDAQSAQVLWQADEWFRAGPELAASNEATEIARAPAPTLIVPPLSTPPPDAVAMATAEAHRIETSIAATLTAFPTSTPTGTPTPDSTATQIALTHALATAVAAALTAQAPTPPLAVPLQPVVSTPLIIPTPRPVLATIEILQPVWGNSVQERREVRWRYTGQLGPNQGFELLLWHELKGPHRSAVDAKWLTRAMIHHGGGVYSFSMDFSSLEVVRQYGDAKYLLAVTVVELEPYRRTGPESDGVQIQVR